MAVAADVGKCAGQMRYGAPLSPDFGVDRRMVQGESMKKNKYEDRENAPRWLRVPGLGRKKMAHSKRTI